MQKYDTSGGKYDTSKRLLIKAVSTEKAEEGGPQITRFVASTADEDRDFDIIKQDWRLEAFKSNPVILWAHNGSIPPVGRAVRAEVVKGKLEIDVEWDEGTDLGATVARQYRQGFLSAGSVGFRPGEVKWRGGLKEEDPDFGERGFVVGSPELLEFSAVPVPANAAALAKGAEASAGGQIDFGKVFARQDVQDAIRAEVRKAVDAELASRPVLTVDDWGDW